MIDCGDSDSGIAALRGRRASRVRLILGNVVIFACGILALEAIGQLWALLRPSYDVVFLEPHPVVGWTLVPQLRWTWTEQSWHAGDFSVPVTANSLGFRDVERARSKPDGVARVALVGDSMVEALQVPLERTAAALHGKKLNAGIGALPGDALRWEVLNFGISGYSVGQYLLVWEEYVRQFEPDTVFVFVSALQMRRTLRGYAMGAFSATRERRLWVRPTFRLEGGALIREPARDFADFVNVQHDLVAAEFDGKRMRRRRESVVGYYATRMPRVRGRNADAAAQRADALQKRALRRFDRQMLPVNLEIIAELDRQVGRAGGRLVVVNAVRYHDEQAEELAEALDAFCETRGIDRVDLATPLLRAHSEGIPTRWTRDVHFNKAGNEIFAETLRHWLVNLAR